MRRTLFVSLFCGAALTFASGARAQTATQPPAPPKTPPPAAPAGAQPAPAAGAEVVRSLFDQTWHQFEISGRASSIDGDPARFQRYGDIRDGLLFTDAKYAREGPDGAWGFRTTADKVGWRDQRYFADYERAGKFTVSGLWDSIPQFYSVDTKTPFNSLGEKLELDNSVQSANQTASTPSLNPYVPLAPQFDLTERRDVGNVSVLATPTPQLDIKGSFNTIRHSGELPWGASFGFSNDVEVALPYDSRTNDFNLGAEWTNKRSMFRVGYSGSWFDNLDDPLVWDSPLDLNDAVENPGQGRMSLWPSNSAQTISAGGYTKFPHRSQLTGFFSLGFWSNNEPLQPFTINSALPVIALPRTTAQADAQIISTNFNFTSHPVDDWRFGGRLRIYDYNNEMPATTITQFVSYDAKVGTSSTGGPENFAHSRRTLEGDATWTGLAPFAITTGFTRNDNGYDFRIFDSTRENVLRLIADAAGLQWANFRAEYEFSTRTGADLDEALLVEIGEQPLMRHYDIADRTRNRFNGQVDLSPNDVWTFSASAGFGKDDFDESYFGLQESTFNTFSLGADFRLPSGFGGGGSYSYERYKGIQRSRNASSDPVQFNDPVRDWTADSAETVNYFSLYAMPPRFGEKTEARVSYDFSYAEGSYFYAIQPGSPITPPNQLPNVFNKLQQLHVDVRHQLADRLVATFSYLYEPFNVYDFAFDPTVVNGIVQPSSLVLGYVYRPYTANSFVFGLRYLWR